MENKNHLIRNIRQKDNHSFVVEWNDGRISTYRLSELQKMCPCAKCVDEVTGKRMVRHDQIDENVRAIKLSNVGRYALRIQFTSGCSTGIYEFDFLRQLG